MVSETPEVVVAGHVCLDMIPSFGADFVPLDALLRPGHLTKVGPVVLSNGGAVSNTGLALHRLGVPVRLMGKIGRDLFGEATLAIFSRHSPALVESMIVSDDEASSYTVVLNPPGIDRMFIHCPGTNDTFGADDIPIDQVAPARIFHFGYPSLMRKLYANGGAELTSLMARVKAAGVITSLDTTQPDPASEAGQVDWLRVLENTLPHVDIFAPNLQETLYIVDRPKYAALQAGDPARLVDGALLSGVAERLLAMGAAIVVLKLGELGLYLRTSADAARLAALTSLLPADLTGWVDRELFTASFRVRVAGTTGAGDCAVAGLLAGLLRGQSAEAILTSAAAVGACSVERADATSGVPRWDEVQARLRSGWPRHPLAIPLPGWHADADEAIWHGPSDPGR